MVYHHSSGNSNGESFDSSVRIDETDKKEGYLFMGWTDTEGSDVVKYEIGDYIYASDMPVYELDLYPVFVEALVGSGSETFDDPYSGFVHIDLNAITKSRSTIWVTDGTLIECSNGYTYTIRSWNGVELSGSGSFTCDVSDKGYAVCDSVSACAAILIKECNAGEGTAEDPFKDGDSMVMIRDGTSNVEVGATVNVIRPIYVYTAVDGMYGTVSLSNGSTSSPITMMASEAGGVTLCSAQSSGTQYTHTVNVIGPEYVDLEFLFDLITDGTISYA